MVSVSRLAVMLPRKHWQRHIARLDPERDYQEIYRIVLTHEFPWDMNQSLSFALFRTYAVPSIGRLLDQTGHFENDTQKRYDDTALLLDEPSLHGLHSDRGRRAVRRINQMHGAYDISNDDMRYVLSTFVVVPKRWLDDYGWRPMSPVEVRASVRYYMELGKLMGIKDVPDTYDGFEELLTSYEAEHFAYDEGARRVADATKDLLLTFYPSFMARPMELFSRALMDEPMLDAFRYDKPSAGRRQGHPAEHACPRSRRGVAAGEAKAQDGRGQPSHQDLPGRLRHRAARHVPAWLPRAARGPGVLMAGPTRGFVGRRRPQRPDRLPPGQYDVGRDWPVLTAEVTPRFDPDDWTMTVDGLVDEPRTWSWEEVQALPGRSTQATSTASRPGRSSTPASAACPSTCCWRPQRPRPEATFVLATSTTGYTTNLPLSDVTDGKAWVVWTYDGRPLPREHGGPVRLLVPHLYFWKSAKWVTRLTLLDHDQQGFWERNGYHDRGDPWLEQRYQGD